MTKLVWSAETKTHYAQLWAGLEARPERKAEAQATARRINARRRRYAVVEASTGVPWWFIGCLHEREAPRPEAFVDYLGNGQPFARKTTAVPAGRGPFDSWDAGAIDALMTKGFSKIEDWSVEHALFLAETFNGPGYWNKGLPSPYVVGASNKQERGKYTVDHEFDASIMDIQIGVATMLKELLAIVPALFAQPTAGRRTGAGVTVPATATTTNFFSVFVSGVIAAFGVQDITADALHLVAALGGVAIALAAVANHLNLTNGSNINTLTDIGSLLARLGDMSAQPAPPDDPVKPAPASVE